jgi:hypothetical protein
MGRGGNNQLVNSNHNRFQSQEPTATLAEGLRIVGQRQDFTPSFMRGQWAEKMVIETINNSDSGIKAIAYGASSPGSILIKGNKQEREKYKKAFALTETLGKRPDILLFQENDYQYLKNKYLLSDGKPIIDSLTITTDKDIPQEIIDMAKKALEVKQSSHRAKEMTDFGKIISRPQKNQRYAKLWFPKRAKAPNLFLKKEDLERLQVWNENWQKPVSIVGAFHDLSMIVPMDRVQSLISNGVVKKEKYSYSKNEVREVHKIWYTLCDKFAEIQQEPEEKPFMINQSGKRTADFILEGGKWELCRDSLFPDNRINVKKHQQMWNLDC